MSSNLTPLFSTNFLVRLSFVVLLSISLLNLQSVVCEENQSEESQESNPQDQTASSSESHDSNVQQQSNYGVRLAESTMSFPMSTFPSKSNQHIHDSKAEESTHYTSGINAIMNSDGFLSQMEQYGSNEPKYSPIGPVEAAVHTKKTIEVIPVKFDQPKEGEPQVIEITPYEVPLSIVFRTQTNKINVNQEHKSEAAEEVKETSSEEEPHRVVHNVYRPVIQEVNEVIQPYRKVMQKVEPVIEEMKTIITKAAPNDGSKPIQQQPQPQQMPQYQRQQQQSTYQSSKNMEFIPMTRTFGGNELGSGSSGLAYGTELIKKYTTAPLSSSSGSSSQASHGDIYVSSDKKLHEMSKRYGFSNGQTNGEPEPETGNENGNSQETNQATNGLSDIGTSFLLSKNELNSKLEPLNAPLKDTNYNEIINGYIEKLLEQKAQQSGSKQSSSNLQINPNNIKIINLPMKGMPDSMDKSKRFKVIQEFRVSLNDLKKQYKVTPINSKYDQKISSHFKEGDSSSIGSLYSQSLNGNQKNRNHLSNFRSFGNGFHPLFNSGPKVTYASSSRPSSAYHMSASTVRKHRMAPSSGRPEPRSANNNSNNKDNFRPILRNNSPKRFGEMSPNNRPNNFFVNRRHSNRFHQSNDRQFSRRRMTLNDGETLPSFADYSQLFGPMDFSVQESQQKPSFLSRFNPFSFKRRTSSPFKPTFEFPLESSPVASPMFGMPRESFGDWRR